MLKGSLASAITVAIAADLALNLIGVFSHASNIKHVKMGEEPKEFLKNILQDGIFSTEGNESECYTDLFIPKVYDGTNIMRSESLIGRSGKGEKHYHNDKLVIINSNLNSNNNSHSNFYSNYSSHSNYNSNNNSNYNSNNNSFSNFYSTSNFRPNLSSSSRGFQSSCSSDNIGDIKPPINNVSQTALSTNIAKKLIPNLTLNLSKNTNMKLQINLKGINNLKNNISPARESNNQNLKDKDRDRDRDRDDYRLRTKDRNMQSSSSSQSSFISNSISQSLSRSHSKTNSQEQGILDKSPKSTSFSTSCFVQSQSPRQLRSTSLCLPLSLTRNQDQCKDQDQGQDRGQYEDKDSARSFQSEYSSDNDRDMFFETDSHRNGYSDGT